LKGKVLSIDDQARALLTEVMTPKRRARQRIAEPLRNAQQVEIETPAGKIAAWRLGDGPAVLLVHGWQDDNSLWSPLISALAEIGVATVTFDLPGHGFSGGDQCTPTLAAAAMQAVAAQLGPIDAVVTHSFGGPVTGFALLNGFAPRRIVLIAAPRGRNKGWFDFAKERGIFDDVVQRAREIATAESGLQTSFDLAAIASPIETLILHSIDDDAVEWDDNAEAIAKAWPNSELVLCDGLGHRMIAQDRGVIERIVTFVA